MTESAALLGCPFCGSEAEMDTRRAYRNITTGDFGDAVAIYCTGCSADICACYADYSGLAEEEIIHLVTELWNRRPSRETPAVVEAVAGAIVKALMDEDSEEDPLSVARAAIEAYHKATGG